MKNNKKPKISTKEIVAKGSVIALLVTVPSLTSFGVSWYLLENLTYAIVIGAIVHFIAMGFSFKISKKFFIQKRDQSSDL